MFEYHPSLTAFAHFQPLKPVKAASGRKANVEEDKEDDSSEGQKTAGKAKKSARDRSSSQFKAKSK